MSTSPMMKQYHDAKQACPEALLLFRMGDFYELFYEDAKTAAKTLGITLTSRDKGENPIPMAGFPHHQLQPYLAKLIAAGFRAAICEQMEDPRQAKGLVRREVTRIVSRGTITDDELLSPQEHNYLIAIVRGEPCGLAWVDISTGNFRAASLCPERLADRIACLEPVECLVGEEDTEAPELPRGTVITSRPPWAFSSQSAGEITRRHFGTKTLAGFGLDEQADTAAIVAVGVVLDYLQETQKTSLAHIDTLSVEHELAALEIDPASRRSLELTRTIRDGRREGSLLDVIDHTVSAMGARQLSDWLNSPLLDKSAIEARQLAVAELLERGDLCKKVRESLAEVYDLPRLVARVTTGRASPRDLSFIGRTLTSLPALKEALASTKDSLISRLAAQIDPCEEVNTRLIAALVDPCPLAIKDGGIIRTGYHAELDSLRALTAGGKKWMAKYQAEQIERTGIPSIKVGFNRVFGYFLEVTHAHSDKVPTEFVRKQTLKNAERYITAELKEHEERVLTADERAKDLEYELFQELREVVAGAGRQLMATAQSLAQLDVLASLAELARRQGYCRPEIMTDAVLEIEMGRHPVLDVLEPSGTFVPNDTSLGTHDGADDTPRMIGIITGPNMAGKSTYIRQVALISIMAQLGSFVPARKARIGIADRIYAHVGASDELSRGQSTFMVEMTETARILNTATSRSLVILDEIGRGTSTYDGISLAWSIVEYLHDQIACRTLFATHYHELTDLDSSLPGVFNLNVAVKEWDDEVVFLHRIVPGSADKSYGIHVARLAGVPTAVNVKAKQILAQLEASHDQAIAAGEVGPATGDRAGQYQLTLFGLETHPVLDEIRGQDLDETTPRQALRLLEEWQTQLAATNSTKPR